jgi:hypothetical protein
VRHSSLVLALLLTACPQATTDKPNKPAADAEADKTPTAAEPEAETEDEPAVAKCTAACVESNVAVAKPADVIEADCRAKCEQN